MHARRLGVDTTGSESTYIALPWNLGARDWSACAVALGLPRSRGVSFPKPFEPAPRHARVVNGVPGITVAEVVLHHPQIRASVGQIKAAGVAERVRMRVLQSRDLGRSVDQVVDSLARQWLPAFGHEQPRQLCGLLSSA